MTPNPYAPPSQSIEVVTPDRRVFRVDSVGAILGRAFSLSLENIASITLITLAVFGPVELLKNLLVDTESANFAMVIRIEWVASAVFGSLVSPAVLHAVRYRVEHGRPMGVLQALKLGLNSWSAVFGARFRSGIKIILGLLVIVPGLIWAVRYTLTDQVATFESRRDAGRVMRRSDELVSGQSWLVAISALLATLIGMAPVAIASGVLSMVMEHWATRTLTDWAADVTMNFAAVTQLVMYLGLSRLGDATTNESVAPTEAPADQIEPVVDG